MIELTKEEVQAVLNTLAEFKYKDVAGLIHFFNIKLSPPKPAGESVTIEKKSDVKE